MIEKYEQLLTLGSVVENTPLQMATSVVSLGQTRWAHPGQEMGGPICRSSSARFGSARM